MYLTSADRKHRCDVQFTGERGRRKSKLKGSNLKRCARMCVDLRELPPMVTVCATIWKDQSGKRHREGREDARDKGLSIRKSEKSRNRKEDTTYSHWFVGAPRLGLTVTTFPLI
jgi:hypothetical protein